MACSRDRYPLHVDPHPQRSHSIARRHWPDWAGWRAVLSRVGRVADDRRA